MKNFAYSILGCLLLSLNAAFAQKTWSFDGQDPLLSCDGKSLLNLYYKGNTRICYRSRR